MRREDMDTVFLDLFGVRFVKRDKNDDHVIVNIHSGDDEYFNPEPAMSFSSFWLPSLIDTLESAQSELKNLYRFKETQEGYSFHDSATNKW